MTCCSTISPSWSYREYDLRVACAGTKVVTCIRACDNRVFFMPLASQICVFEGGRHGAFANGRRAAVNGHHVAVRRVSVAGRATAASAGLGHGLPFWIGWQHDGYTPGSYRTASTPKSAESGHEGSSRAHRQRPVRCHPALIPAALMIGHQFSISVFWNAASASAKINTEARSFSCLLRPTICRCHADLADWLDDQPVPGEGQPSFERHVTGERQSVADRVAE